MSDKHILLIVEDEETAAKALTRKFKSSGYETMLAKDGEEAIALMGKQSFNVVLLDVILPKKDGYEVLEEMKKAGNKTPVVVLSNLSANTDSAHSRELGAAAHFVKSMTPMKKVVEFIDTLVKKQS